METYVKTINIESLLTSNIARTMLLPAGLKFQRDLAETIGRTREALKTGAELRIEEDQLHDVVDRVSRLKESIDRLDSVRAEAEGHHGDLSGHARFYRDRVRPAMEDVREQADGLEQVVDDAHWPLPKYREMLFVY
jgi:glutamine synthetase